MSSIRKQFIKQVEARLDRRKLVWFGTRGTDSQALLQISQFSEVFSLVAPLILWLSEMKSVWRP